VVFATWAQRRRDRQSAEGRDPTSHAGLEELPAFLDLCQKSVERVDELQSRLPATVLETDQLRAPVTYLRQEDEACWWSATTCDLFSCASVS
jgi:hypothetical protein